MTEGRSRGPHRLKLTGGQQHNCKRELASEASRAVPVGWQSGPAVGSALKSSLAGWLQVGRRGVTTGGACRGIWQRRGARAGRPCCRRRACSVGEDGVGAPGQNDLHARHPGKEQEEGAPGEAASPGGQVHRSRKLHAAWLCSSWQAAGTQCSNGRPACYAQAGCAGGDLR